MATDPLERMTVAELDAASRLLKTDVVTAIADETGEKWAGLGIVAWILAKRDDPTAALSTFRAMSAGELYDALGVTEPAAAADPVLGDDGDTAADGAAAATAEAEPATDSASAVDDLAPLGGAVPNIVIANPDDDVEVEAAMRAYVEAQAARNPNAAPADYGADTATAQATTEAERVAALRERIVADPMGRRRG